LITPWSQVFLCHIRLKVAEKNLTLVPVCLLLALASLALVARDTPRQSRHVSLSTRIRQTDRRAGFLRQHPAAAVGSSLRVVPTG
jgi:hypothetical protein